MCSGRVSRLRSHCDSRRQTVELTIRRVTDAGAGNNLLGKTPRYIAGTRGNRRANASRIPRSQPTHHLVGRVLLIGAQAAVTDGLLVGTEPRVIADLQRPRQGRDRADSWHGSQPPLPLLEQRVSLQRADQVVLQLPGAADHSAAQVQQRPYSLADVFVRRHQLTEIAYLVGSRRLL